MDSEAFVDRHTVSPVETRVAKTMARAGIRVNRIFAITVLAAAQTGCGGVQNAIEAAVARQVDSAAASLNSAATTAVASAANSAANTIATSSPTVAGSGAIGTTVTSKDFIDKAIALVNAGRSVARKCGTTNYPAVGALKWQAQAEQAALTQAQYLQQNNLFTHDGAGGSTVGSRLTATGYVWQSVGENIAAGFPDLETTVKGWFDSEGHCANLMNAAFTDLGVAGVLGSSTNSYKTYWGMVLARPQ
ncbi:MAG: CAP domain-containing protein [Burkholderiales bacterium]|nr:CAP domain-containing protein [Burkholderiales bacterium]